MLWRSVSLLGGVGGFVSLLLPYALVSGGVLGVAVRAEPYTLFELAGLVADTGNDPRMVYLLVVLVVVGSTLAFIGAVTRRAIAIGGGLVQGVAAAAFAYGATTEGSQTVLYGLSQLELSFEAGFFLLVIASSVSLSTALWN